MNFNKFSDTLDKKFTNIPLEKIKKICKDLVSDEKNIKPVDQMDRDEMMSWIVSTAFLIVNREFTLKKILKEWEVKYEINFEEDDEI